MSSSEVYKKINTCISKRVTFSARMDYQSVVTLPKKGRLQQCQNKRNILAVSRISKQGNVEDNPQQTLSSGRGDNHWITSGFPGQEEVLQRKYSISWLLGGKHLQHQPSGLMTFIQRCLNDDATSWRCIDVEATLYRLHVSARSEVSTRYQESFQQDMARSLWATMRKNNINVKLIQVTERLYDKASSAILFSGFTRKTFRTTV